LFGISERGKKKRPPPQQELSQGTRTPSFPGSTRLTKPWRGMKKKKEKKKENLISKYTV